MKKEIVLWSGGWDSTLVAIQKLKHSSQENPVLLIAMNCANFGEEQQKMEEKARKTMLKMFIEKGWHVEYNIAKLDYDGDTRTNGLFQQPVAMSTLALFAIENSNCSLGVLKGDDYWQHSNKLSNIFWNIVNTKIIEDVTLQHPLKLYSKKDVIEEITKEGFDKVVVTCDCPEKGKECGKCIKCTAIKVARYEMRLDKKNQKEVIPEKQK